MPPPAPRSPLTPAQRALLARRLRAGADAPAAPAAAAAPAPAGEVPASSAQRRLYFLDRYRPGSPAYLVPAVLELRGPLDADALGWALSELVRRHEALRTTYAERDGEPVQIVAEPFPLRPRTEDLSGLAPAERARLLRRAAAAQTQEAMDLARGPLVRARLLRLEPELHHLVLTLHHILVDGWTLSLLVRECAALYEARRLDRPEAAPAPPPLQYTAYALAERDRLAGQEARAELDWWTERLRGVPALELPTDRPRPAVQGWAGARHALTVPEELTGRLRALAARTGTTLFMVLLAAYQVVLHRWSGQDDFAVGTPVAGRTSPHLEGLAGLVANTLVLRAELSGDPDFTTVLERTAATALDAFERQGTPFELLVERLEQGRDPSRHPLFQCSFTLQNVPPFQELRMADVAVRALDMAGDTAKFDLGLTLLEADGGLRGEVEYSTDLFDADTAARFAGHWLTVLRAVADDPARRLSELPLLAPGEHAALLEAARGPVLPEGEATREPVPAQVVRRARQTPGALAVADPERSLTYGALAGYADVLARRLRALGAGPEQRVGVCLERSCAQVVAALAVTLTGAAYVPLDPQYPTDRLTAIRQDAGLRLLVTDRDLRTRFPMGRADVLCVEDVLDGEPAPVTGVPVPRLDPRALAYVVHTSGSTGRPKGVAVEHRALAGLAAWHRDAYALGPGDRSTLVASPGFDAAVWEMWPALASGAELHVPSDATRADPARLARFLAERQVTVCFLPTPLAEAVLAEPFPAHGPLRSLLTGGDALTARPAPGAPYRLYNHYGPTENTVVATAGPVAGATGDGAGARRPDIGRPTAGVYAHVLDARLRPVPVGVAGELYLGGDQVARGYLGDPRRTAERFVPDPFSGRPGARMYATGDRVRRLPDGTLEFLGRCDDQMKVRGFRIEPGEVEAALRAHPAVADAAVTLHRGADGAALVGHVVPGAGAAPAADELRRHLRGLLPSYMVPAHLVVRQALPLTAHGKVDRRELARAPLPAPRQEAPTAPPRGPSEERVAAVWQEVLGVARVGAHDNFFDLGGHSFLALRVRARLQEALGREIPVVAVFQYPTVAAFAAYLDAAGDTGGARNAEEADGAWKDRRRAALGLAARRRAGRHLPT
ncbi:non-ribosomal peptide synthetase [Streptomyces mexicanus]|uniref:non-ribosomal peptide synthetase n=1 Tax=Streptomyces mexicanus TaxID=178566 RepID=UPI00365E0800